MPGGLIDRGGAEVWRRSERTTVQRHRMVEPPPAPKPAARVVVEVVETHDGKPCACVDSPRKELTVGDVLELTHVCHDGRVDVVRATVVSITA